VDAREALEVKVLCFGAMREFLPPGTSANSTVVQVPPGSRVGHVVDAFGAPRRLVYALLVDGVQATLESEVQHGSEVTLMPPFAGGSETKRGH
jgi:molybdopterin converting factor small subunit